MTSPRLPAGMRVWVAGLDEPVPFGRGKRTSQKGPLIKLRKSAGPCSLTKES